MPCSSKHSWVPYLLFGSTPSSGRVLPSVTWSCRHCGALGTHLAWEAMVPGQGTVSSLLGVWGIEGKKGHKQRYSGESRGDPESGSTS